MNTILHSSIAEAEQAYIEAGKAVTEACLALEKTCTHSWFCGKDATFGLDGIYICLNCRMEVHNRNGSLLSMQVQVPGCVILSERQCKIDNILSLRIKGDQRSYLKTDYSFFNSWPKRPETTGEGECQEDKSS